MENKKHKENAQMELNNILNKINNLRKRENYFLSIMDKRIEEVQKYIKNADEKVHQSNVKEMKIENQASQDIIEQLNILRDENKRLKRELYAIKKSKGFKFLVSSQRLLNYIVKLMKKYLGKLLDIYINRKVKEMTEKRELRKFKLSRGKVNFVLGKRLSIKLKEQGQLTKNLYLLKMLGHPRPEVRYLEREISIIKDKLELINHDKYNFQNVSPIEYYSEKVQNIKVLNVVNTSEPYHINGYGMRGRYIFKGQKEWGIKPIICTRPGFPNDYKQRTVDNYEILKENYEGLDYYRNNTETFQRYTPVSEYIEKYSSAIDRIIDKENPHIVHAASNYVIGLSGMRSAELNQKPFIYEMRGLWHVTKLVTVPEYKNSQDYKLAEKMEVYTAQKANIVITISNAIKNWLVIRGVREDKIRVIPNGVDSKKIHPKEFDKDLKQKYFQDDDFVMGFIGSITKLEGLQKVLMCLSRFKKIGITNIKFLVAGEGSYLEELKERAKKLKVQELVVFTGRIPHSKIMDYYSVFDMCIFPREDEEVCRIVPPLKILEAMACEKTILVSNLEALRETVIEEENGMVFDNTLDDMCKKIFKVYENPVYKKEIGKKARAWVIENRDWSKLTYNLKQIYNELLQ